MTRHVPQTPLPPAFSKTSVSGEASPVASWICTTPESGASVTPNTGLHGGAPPVCRQISRPWTRRRGSAPGSAYATRIDGPTAGFAYQTPVIVASAGTRSATGTRSAATSWGNPVGAPDGMFTGAVEGRFVAEDQGCVRQETT